MWYELEKQGWSWAVGWNPNYGGYYVQAWRDLPKPIVVEGKRIFRECFTESGKSISEAESKLWQRLSRLGN